MNSNSVILRRFLGLLIIYGWAITSIGTAAASDALDNGNISKTRQESAQSQISSSAPDSANSDASEQTNSHGVPVKPVNQKEQQYNSDTANAVNRIPGAKIEPKDLQPPAEDAPIHGFHPIKKMLQPVERLEKNSMQLQQQIMKLEGPIAGLQPPMLGLQKKMSSVEQKMGTMQGRIGTISEQMTGVRSDLGNMRQQISQLNVPVRVLQRPLIQVADPLKTLDQKLEKLAALLTSILFAIMVAAVAVAVGTPVAAVLIYKNRGRLFPNLSDREFPTVKSASETPTSQTSKPHVSGPAKA